ncbi:mitochondrial Rho GTPase 1-like [Hibiscus syriacus]|uniref:Mitochondrial Rho GTPase 1-like n=1 Tax=Hibiscus syriacus TaxID=106335 RepID=A0A6A3BXN5_HIBSY|nr:mitochondrial Rho GTPase 1-like [Hibiscus syriacus]
MTPFLSIRFPASPSVALFHFCPSPPLFSCNTKSPFRRFLPPTKTSLSNNSFSLQLGTQGPENQQRPRTLFPGGYKRPEIKFPNFVLQLDPDDVLSDVNALAFIDKAISKWVGLVVLNGGEGSGGAVYEAAHSLKAVLKDRAYLLISEHADIAAAVGASCVVLSDQGLPAIVARNAMMDSKSDFVFLPLVARTVQSSDAALNASSSEGADFLIYDVCQEEHAGMTMKSVYENVKIPIFIVNNSSQAEDESFNELMPADIVHDYHQKTSVAGFINVEDREKQLIEKESSVLTEAKNVFQKAAPLMEEISLLIDAVAQIDEPFLLAIVGEFNSGKSTVINALLGERCLTGGVIPTTNEITFLRYSELDGKDMQCCERHPDGQLICYLPAPILKEMNIVDTPGTNVILQRQQRLTEEFVPRVDLLLVISADRPLTESEMDQLVMERMKLKLGTPIAIAEQILSACETLNRKNCESAEQDLASINEIVNSVKEYVIKMEDEILQIDATKSQILELIESTLQLSNPDIASFLLEDSSATLPATSRVQNDMLGPALADAQVG